VRENGESIALLGARRKNAGRSTRISPMCCAMVALARSTVRTTLVSQGSSLIAPVVPLLLCAPKFLDGSMRFGQVMQARRLHHRADRFGWWWDNYPRLADWNACARRIASLTMSLDGWSAPNAGDGIGRFKRGEDEGDAMFSLNDLSVTLARHRCCRETEVGRPRPGLGYCRTAPMVMIEPEAIAA